MLFLVVRRSSLGFGSFLGGGVEGIIVVLAVMRLSLCYSLCSIRSGGSLFVSTVEKSSLHSTEEWKGLSLVVLAVQSYSKCSSL